MSVCAHGWAHAWMNVQKREEETQLTKYLIFTVKENKDQYWFITDPAGWAGGCSLPWARGLGPDSLYDFLE